MPTKRDNEIKEFAIGTKIEYNSKLYEVVKQKFCDECSLKHICPTTDVIKHTDCSNLLSRDERVKIFGECSPIKRKDHNSIVFKEIPINISKDKYYKISPLFRDDNPSKLKSVEFDLPNGCEIDIEASDLSKGIVHFKRKWLTLEQIYKLAEENDYLTNRSAIKEYRDGKLGAIANLMDIAKYFNGNWEYSNNGDNYGYMIGYDKTRTIDDGYQVVNINSDTDMYYGNIMFKNEADAQYVIDNPNFRSILDVIFKV